MTPLVNLFFKNFSKKNFFDKIFYFGINKIMRLVQIFFLFFCLSTFADKIPESYYQKKFATTIPNAQLEVVAPDGTRCDILTDEYAIEVDFAKKWAEAIGQSLNYALQFNKKAGIVLILENQYDYKYSVRLNSIIQHFNLPIRLWNIKYDEVKDTQAQQGQSSLRNNNNPAQSGEYWISKSGVRHNSSCRYYERSKGRKGNKSDGRACKICGG